MVVQLSQQGALTFNRTNHLANNGGAIYAAVQTSLSFTGTSSLSSNSAMQGGAISAYTKTAPPLVWFAELFMKLMVPLKVSTTWSDVSIAPPLKR